MADTRQHSTHSQPDTLGLRPNRACRNCVQIKAKCVPLTGSDPSVCQRCHRLRKPCSTAAPAVRKRPKEKLNRVTQLEKRLDEVTSLLATIRRSPSPVQHDASLPTPTTLPATSPQEASGCLETVSIHGTHSDAASAPPQQSDHCRLFPQFDPGLDEELFLDFLRRMQYFFPFVILPPGLSAASMRETRPHLYRAIIFAAGRRFPERQKQLADGILEIIGKATLLRGEKSLDLFQGLLVFIAWYHYLGHGNPQLMNLMHLSLAMAVDLGLSSTTFPQIAGSGIAITVDAERIIHGKSGVRGAKTNEERRAVLATYYLTSTYSFCFRRLEYLKSSPHQAQCCEVLAATPEYPSDQHLVAIIKLQQLLDKYLLHSESKPDSKLPFPMYVQLFRQELRSLLAGLPPTVLTEEIFDLHLSNAQVCFYASLIHMPCDTTLDKVEALHAGLLKLKEYFESFFTQYSTSMPTISFLYWMHILHGLGVLTKLSFLHLEGWDLQYVRSALNFGDVIDRLNEKLWVVREAEEAKFNTACSSKFRIQRAKLDRCKVWFNEMLAQEAKAQDADAIDLNDPIFSGMLDGLEEYLHFDVMANFPENAET